MASLFASEPQSVGGVLDQAFRLSKAALLPVVPFALAQAGITLLLQGVRFGPWLLAGATGAPPANFGNPMLALVFLPLYAVLLVIGAASLYRVYETGAGAAPPSIAWQRGRRRAWPAFLASVLFMLPVVLLGVIAGIVVPALHLDLSPGLIVILGLLALAVILQWTTRAFLFMPEVVVGAVGPVSAIKASLRLTRGRVMRLSAVLLVGLLVGLGVYVVVGLLVGVGSVPLARALAVPPAMTSVVTALILSLVIAAPMAAFTGALSLSLWHDLKLRAEGTDLGARIDALSSDA
jgi:hypothetical protein